MNDIQLGVIESKFADIIWQNEPLTSSDLVKLSESGLFQNNKGTVTSLLSRDEFYSMQSEKFVEDTFGGSFPAFLAAFTKRKNLTKEEVAELRRMVAEYEED